MTIRFHNTLSGKKEEFRPITPGKAGIYCCGPTVYSYSHIGHMVGPVIFDTLKRFLKYSGFDVTFVINITDIDDKIINQAAKDGENYAELAVRVTKDYQENLQKLGVEVDQFPQATHYIKEMHDIIADLIKKDFAYAAAGDVYFDVAKKTDYGKLSNRKLDELLAGTRKEVSDIKRSAEDFALWKGAKPGEPAWESPWGPGRPGWHIECSAMSMKILGETFDIHGGGLDLVFPHHEDEIAQSEAHTGKPFANIWMHNGLMQRSKETRKIGAREGDPIDQEAGKMGKSKGNAIVIRDLLGKYSPELLRFFLVSTHYRRPIEFGDDRLEETGKGLARFHQFFERFGRITGESYYDLVVPAKRAPLAFEAKGEFLGKIAEHRQRFLDFLDDDFNTGGAIGVLFELLTLLNRFADENKLEDSSASAELKQELKLAGGVVKELASVLYVLNKAPEKAIAGDELTPKLMELILELRQEARKAKNFAWGDLIRNRLSELGIVIEDRASGSTWKLK